MRGAWHGTNSGALGAGIVGAAAAAAAALLIYEGRGITFTGDEWAYAGHLITHSGPDRFLTSPGSDYAMPVPLLVLKAMLEAFGMTSYVPYRLLGVAAHLVCAGLLFALLRRRIGAVPAAVATIPVLFLAASDQGQGVDAVTMSARRLPMLLAIAFGLGALLALERRSHARDATACCLLALSLASHPVALGFTAIAAVTVLGAPEPDSRLRGLLSPRALVFVLPLALWIAISLLFGHGAGDLSLGRFISIPGYMAESLAAAGAALAGMGNSPLVSGSAPASGVVPWVLAAAAVGACAWAVIHRRAAGDRSLSALWAAGAGLAVLLLATAIQPGSGEVGSPEAPRYVYAEAILLVVVIGEAFRGVSLGPRNARVAVAGVAVAVIGSVLQLVSIGSGMRNLAVAERAELRAIEAAARARAEVADRSPTAALVAAQAATRPLGGELAVARRYALGGLSPYVITRLTERYGSPALDHEEIERAPAAAQNLASDVYGRLIRARPGRRHRLRPDGQPRSMLVPAWYRAPNRTDRHRQ
jgi:hypothetical protein